ncbi:hypothetical protein [Streptomyces griseoluteus]|uniref:hypothetical protein n=1 Tax=Streptomyces griseoluteus TaxID=29306 RepID=UPI003807BCDA
MGQLAATLRPDTRSLADDPVGNHHAEEAPLLLLPYGRHGNKASGLTGVADASDVLVRHAEYQGITADNCIALAYSNSAARKAHSGSALHPPKRASSGMKLAWVAVVFTAPKSPPAAGQHALTIATLLSDYWHLDAEGSLTEALVAYYSSPALMCRRAVRFLAALPPVHQTPARVWRSAALAILKAQRPPYGVALARPKALKLATRTGRTRRRPARGRLPARPRSGSVEDPLDHRVDRTAPLIDCERAERRSGPQDQLTGPLVRTSLTALPGAGERQVVVTPV